MKKNFKEALITFIGGIGVIPILLSIFSGHIEFGLSIVIAFPFFLVAGVLNGLLVESQSKSGPLTLNKQQKEAITIFISGIGVFVVIIGIFWSALSFGYTIVCAYGFFLIAGILNILIEEETSSDYKEQFYPPENKDKTLFKKGTSDSVSDSHCSSCGSQIENDSIFCTQCGKKYISS